MNFLVLEGRRLCRRLGLSRPALGGDFDFLANHLFEGKLDLQGGWRFALADLNARLAHWFEADCRTGKPVGSRNQPRKLKSPMITSSYRTPLFRQSST